MLFFSLSFLIRFEVFFLTLEHTHSWLRSWASSIYTGLFSGASHCNNGYMDTLWRSCFLLLSVLLLGTKVAAGCVLASCAWRDAAVPRNREIGSCGLRFEVGLLHISHTSKTSSQIFPNSTVRQTRDLAQK